MARPKSKERLLHLCLLRIRRPRECRRKMVSRHSKRLSTTSIIRLLQLSVTGKGQRILNCTKLISNNRSMLMILSPMGEVESLAVTAVEGI